MAWHEEGDALDLIRIRRERQPHLFAGEQILERRLEEIEQPVLEEDHVTGRLEPRLTAASLRLRWRSQLGIWLEDLERRRGFPDDWLSRHGEAPTLRGHSHVQRAQ